MKKSILILTLLLLTLLPASAIKRIEANPINIAFSLCKETDAANINSTLEYYGYEQISDSPLKTEDSRLKTEYRHPNGSIIRITPPSGGWGASSYPTVEVKSNRGSNDVEDALTSLNFKKSGSIYIRKVGQHSRTETQCTHSHQGYLVLHQTIIPRQE